MKNEGDWKQEKYKLLVFQWLLFILFCLYLEVKPSKMQRGFSNKLYWTISAIRLKLKALLMSRPYKSTPSWQQIIEHATCARTEKYFLMEYFALWQAPKNSPGSSPEWMPTGCHKAIPIHHPTHDGNQAIEIKEGVIKFLIDLLLQILRKLCLSMRRDLRYQFRTIVRFIFKNMDDETGDNAVLSTIPFKTVFVNYLHRIKWNQNILSSNYGKSPILILICPRKKDLLYRMPVN